MGGMGANSDLERRLGEKRLALKEAEAVARQIPTLKKEIEELAAQLESEEFHAPKGGKAKSSPKKELQQAPMPPMKQAAQVLTGEAASNRMRNINKKLQQIAKLKEKEPSELDDDARAKVRAEPKLRKELKCIQNGEGYESDGEDMPLDDMRLPTDAAEVEKRIKALKKKLQQIDALKAKGDDVDDDARAKMAGERRLKQELEALEAGEDHVVFAEPSLDEILLEQQNEKHSLERRHKAIMKKIAQIDKLKQQDDSTLDADMRSKIASEKELKKELNSVQRAISEWNKKERARVEARLG